MDITGVGAVSGMHAVSGASSSGPPQQKMSDLFDSIDTSGSGSITKSQFDQAFQSKNPPAVFQKQGADAIFAGGIFDLNGGQLIKDKVAVLGPNTGVKFIAPDGFTGYPDFLALPEAEGAYLTFAGLSTDPLKAAGGVPAKFIEDFNAEYGMEPRTPYALYGVQALQVILAAIAGSVPRHVWLDHGHDPLAR